jgi:site-specific recombinase XerC
MPTTLTGVRREHMEAFLVDLEERGQAAATLSLHYRALRPFFAWAVGEDEIERSPMERIRPPKVPVEPPPVLTVDQMRRLLDAVKGKTFEDRRDINVRKRRPPRGVRRLGLPAPDDVAAQSGYSGAGT